MSALCSSGCGVAMETAAGPVAMDTAAPPGGQRHALLAVIGEIGTEPERGALRCALERGEERGRGGESGARRTRSLPLRAAGLRACRVVRAAAWDEAELPVPSPPCGTSVSPQGFIPLLLEGRRTRPVGGGCGKDRGAVGTGGAEAEAEAVGRGRGPGGGRGRVEGEAGRGSDSRRSAEPVSAASGGIRCFFSPDHCFICISDM